MTCLKMLLWLIIIPYLLGKFLESEDKNNFLSSWVLGYIVEMGICLIWAIPMIVTKTKFEMLLRCYNISIYIIVLLAIIINRQKIIPKFNMKPKISFWQCIAIFLVFTQIFIKFRYTNINNDDSSFVVLGLKMIENGYMYCDGVDSQLIIRRALAPLSAFFAILSQNLGIHITIVMHTIEPMLFMAIGGIIFYNLGKVLFKENKDLSYIFLIFMILLYTYFFTSKGAGLYYLQFTWFGRSLIGAIFLPLLWKVMLEISDNSDTIRNWVTVFFIVLASCLSSEMAIVLVSIPIVVMSAILMIRSKKKIYILKSAVCIVPCIILGILYLILN